MQFDDDVFDRVDADYVMVRVDGLLVPFFFEEYRFRSESTCIVKLWGKYDQYMVYYNSLNDGKFKVAEPSIQSPLYMMKHITDLVEQLDENLYNDYALRFDMQWQQFVSKGGGRQ